MRVPGYSSPKHIKAHKRQDMKSRAAGASCNKKSIKLWFSTRAPILKLNFF